MGKRGPKSSAEMSVVVPITGKKLPSPPDDLTDEQAATWNTICRAMPGDWFAIESQPLLAAYCRHVATARHIAERIEKYWKNPLGIEHLDRLLKIQARESSAIASLATKLRLTQQSRYNAKSADTARRNAGGSRLWDDPDDPAREFLD